MANNVYIGSRYVPIFDGDWDNTKTYEALTIVSYGNNSYTSKRPVPLNTPPTGQISDPYWALTGNLNGQISNLQTQIDGINAILPTKLYDNANRGFIFQGDSYDTIYTHGWSEYAAADVGCTYFKIDSGGGYGFRPANSSPNYGKNWIDLLIADTSIDDDKITDICVCGGSNDRSQTDAQLLDAMQEYDTYVKGRFPNLKNIYLGFIGFDYIDAATVNDINAKVARYKNYALDLGWSYLDGVQYICRNPHNMSSTSRNHYSEGAVSLVGRYVAHAIKCGSCEYCVSETTAFTENTSYITSGTGKYNVVFEIRGGMLKVVPSQKQWTAQSTLTGTISNILTSDMGNFMTRSLGIDVWVRYSGVNHMATLRPNPNNVANLDLVFDEPSFSIPSGASFIIMQTYKTILL